MGRERDPSEREQGQPDEFLGPPHPVPREPWEVDFTDSMTPTEARAFLVDVLDDSASVSFEKVTEPGGGWPVGWVASYRRGDDYIGVSGSDQRTAMASLRVQVAEYLLERAVASMPAATDIDPFTEEDQSISLHMSDGGSWVVALDWPDGSPLRREYLSDWHPDAVIVVLPIDQRLLDIDATIEAILQEARGGPGRAEQTAH